MHSFRNFLILERRKKILNEPSPGWRLDVRRVAKKRITGQIGIGYTYTNVEFIKYDHHALSYEQVWANLSRSCVRGRGCAKAEVNQQQQNGAKDNQVKVVHFVM